MKKIYSLETKLEDNPKIVELTQNLTLNENRPMRGLMGKYGLYGTTEWWGNLYSGVIPRKVYEGIIAEINLAGMHNESLSFSLNLTDGSCYKYTCVANRKRNMKLYQVGRKVRVTVFIEKMKNGADQEFVWQVEIENA